MSAPSGARWCLVTPEPGIPGLHWGCRAGNGGRRGWQRLDGWMVEAFVQAAAFPEPFPQTSRREVGGCPLSRGRP